MNSISSPVPEHSLRHREPIAISTCEMDTVRLPIGKCTLGAGGVVPEGPAGIIAVGTNGGRSANAQSSTRAWPFSAQDASPLAWWRTLPSDLLRDAEHLLVRTTLDGITVIHGGDDFPAALCGDSASAIAVALSLMPIEEKTLQVDIAMTAVLRCALDGNAAAALVLAHVLGRAELGHSFSTELSASWYTHHLRYSPDRRRFTPAEKVLWSTLRKYDKTPSHNGGRS